MVGAVLKIRISGPSLFLKMASKNTQKRIQSKDVLSDLRHCRKLAQRGKNDH